MNSDFIPIKNVFLLGQNVNHFQLFRKIDIFGLSYYNQRSMKFFDHWFSKYRIGPNNTSCISSPVADKKPTEQVKRFLNLTGQLNSFQNYTGQVKNCSKFHRAGQPFFQNVTGQVNIFSKMSLGRSNFFKISPGKVKF